MRSILVNLDTHTRIDGALTLRPEKKMKSINRWYYTVLLYTREYVQGVKRTLCQNIVLVVSKTNQLIMCAQASLNLVHGNNEWQRTTDS